MWPIWQQCKLIENEDYLENVELPSAVLLLRQIMPNQSGNYDISEQAKYVSNIYISKLKMVHLLAISN